MNRLTFRLVCLSACIVYAWACTKKIDDTPKGTVFQRLIGQDVTTVPYDGAGSDDAVTTGDQLNCDFESGCCWTNAPSPPDTQEWVLGQGAPEESKMQSTFGTTTMPTSTFLAVGVEAGDGNTPQSAELFSCSIACSASPITLTVTTWKAKDVTMQACTEESGNGPTSNCKTLSGASGQPSTVQFPIASNQRLVIIAKGFTTKTGSVAMIDDIQVQFDECVSQTEPTTTPMTDAPTTTPAAICNKITCNFEDGNPCAYTNATSNGGNKKWQVVKAPFQNPLTGISKAAEGNSFTGVYLNPGDTAVMSTDVPDFPNGYVVKFNYYRATEGVDLLGCCGDTTTCPFSSTKQVQVSDYRSWKSSTMTCPQGVNKVIFEAKDSGKNQGAVGLDDVQLLLPGSDGDTAC